MPLSLGDKLGPYEVLSPIGAGGMGEVYKVRDSKLDREVAIKVLPAALAHDQERLTRFEREAKVLASLNHPNIAQIYGIEESGHGLALVMELVPGQTLKGPLPVPEALQIATQIALALEAAHEKGIIHRDLKPANIMVTPAGVVKVLDFGLAAVSLPQTADATDPSNSPTLTMAATQAGMIMGTAGYMAPEQAAGKPIDKRVDIWAYGVVLFEMLTGAPLFSGETVSHTLADVLRAPIDFDTLPKETPRAVRELLKRCLDRNPKRRLRDIGEALFVIANAGEETTASAAPARPSRSSRLAWTIAGLMALVALVLAVVHFPASAPPEPVLRFSIPLPASAGSASGTNAELSPDGRFLTYTSTAKSGLTIWLRPLNSALAKPLIHEPARSGAYPFWSPDSRWIVYASGEKLKKIDVTAASPTPIVLCECVSSVFRGGTWSRDGVLLFAPGTASGLMQLPASGGTPRPATTLDARHEALHRFPRFLPDGQHFLYFVGSGDSARSGVYLGDLRNPQSGKRILDADSHAAFVPASAGSALGHLLYVKDNSLRAIPFDAGRGEISGEPEVLANGVSDLNSRGQFSASANEILAYWTGDPYVAPVLRWYGRDGNAQSPVLADGAIPSGSLSGLSLSPAGSRLAIDSGRTAGKVGRIWLIDLLRAALNPMFSAKERVLLPIWSPDSKRIAFAYSPAGVSQLAVTSADQPAPPEILYASPNNNWPRDWASGGSPIVFETSFGDRHELWALSLSDRKAYTWAKGAASQSQGQLAPGASNPWWMAYVSDDSGRSEVYLESFTLAGNRAGRVQVSTNGGNSPRWRADGRELYFIGPGSKMMAVTVRPGFGIDTPRELFVTPALVSTSIFRGQPYAVTADGKRFLLATAPETKIAEPLSIVVNWRQELR